MRRTGDLVSGLRSPRRDSPCGIDLTTEFHSSTTITDESPSSLTVE